MEIWLFEIHMCVYLLYSHCKLFSQLEILPLTGPRDIYSEDPFGLVSAGVSAYAPPRKFKLQLRREPLSTCSISRPLGKPLPAGIGASTGDDTLTRLQARSLCPREEAMDVPGMPVQAPILQTARKARTSRPSEAGQPAGALHDVDI